MDYCEENILIEALGHQIPATVTIPSKKEQTPLILLLHGTGSNRHEVGGGYDTLAKLLSEKFALASLRIDFQGCGDSTSDFRNFNFQSAVDDALKAVQFAVEHYPVDANRIGVLGWSQGGTDALLVAGTHPELFKAVVTWAGAPDLQKLFTEEDYEEAKRNGFFLRHFDWREALPFSFSWCEDVQKTDVLSVFSQTKAPVLAIAGTSDTVVDPAWATKIVEKSDNEASEVFLIEGMDHTFNVFGEENQESLKTAIDKTGTFFLSTL